MVTCIHVFAEDILDEVSGLTVTSPDEAVEEEPQLLLRSPAGHQEGKISVGTGHKVGWSGTGRAYDRMVCACGSQLVFPRLKELWDVPFKVHPDECAQQVLG